MFGFKSVVTAYLYKIRYHWAFIVGPKVEPNTGGEGTRYHAIDRATMVGQPSRVQFVWQYEEKAIHLYPTQMLLVRIVIGKVKDTARLQSIFRQIPVRPGVPGWNCVGWVQEALQAVASDKRAVGTPISNWDSIRDTAMWYAESKRAAHRFDGKAAPGQYDTSKAATWDMLEGKELIP